MLFGVVDILFSCTPRLFTSEIMVHHDITGFNILVSVWILFSGFLQFLFMCS